MSHKVHSPIYHVCHKTNGEGLESSRGTDFCYCCNKKELDRAVNHLIEDYGVAVEDIVIFKITDIKIKKIKKEHLNIKYIGLD